MVAYLFVAFVVTLFVLIFAWPTIDRRLTRLLRRRGDRDNWSDYYKH